MYLDVKGLVTTGIGNLIDSVGAAQALPWRHGANGPLASASEVADAWNNLKSHQELKLLGGGNKAFQNLNDLRLDADGIKQVVLNKLDANEVILRTRFPGFDAWPADAQLGLLSMAWAMGPNFKFPKFEAAVNQLAPDFKAAAALSHMNAAGNPGLVPRNTANEALFNSAGDVVAQGLDFTQVQWSGFEDLLSKGTAALASGIKSATDAVSTGYNQATVQALNLADLGVSTVKKNSKLAVGVGIGAAVGGAVLLYAASKGSKAKRP